MTVEIDSKLEFSIDDHITQDIGSIFNKVELLELKDFAYFSNGVVTILPKKQVKPGTYPLIVRITDKQSRPQQKQYTFRVEGVPEAVE